MPFECKVIAIGQLFGEFSVVGETEASFNLRLLAPVERLVDVSINETDKDFAALLTPQELKAAIPSYDPLRQWLEDLPPHVSAIMVHLSEWNRDQISMQETQTLRSTGTEEA